MPKIGTFGHVLLPENDQPQEVKYYYFETSKLKVKFLNFGCIIQSLETIDENKTFDDIALGFETPQEYIEKHMYYGTVVGRVANRIMDGKFSLNNTDYQLVKNNNNLAHLHGGYIGWGRKIWDVVEVTDTSVTFEYVSCDGEEGYPCEVKARVQYSIIGEDKLNILYTAKNQDKQKSTLINMTNHSYFNLSGHKNYEPNLDNHSVSSSCKFYTPLNDAMCPTGEIKSVTNTPFDFSGPGGLKLTKETLEGLGNGYDHNFCFGRATQSNTISIPGGSSDLKEMFKFEHINGRKMTVLSSAVGAQFYTCNFFKGHKGKFGISHERQGGFACETQDYPDSVNHAHFPTSTVYGPGEEYKHETMFVF